MGSREPSPPVIVVGAVGRAAGNLAKCHLSGMAVMESHNHHAEVQKIGDDREQRRLLPAMLRGARVYRRRQFISCFNKSMRAPPPNRVPRRPL